MKVLFIDKVHPILKERLTEKGFNCDEFPEKNHEELIDLLPHYDGVVIRSKFKFTKEVFDCATQLKFIARSGAGMENIDLQYAQQKNVKCYNSPEGNRDAVGEHALGMLLSLFNKINYADIEVRQGLWRREANRGIEIKGKTIGIIGVGNMGHAFAQRLSGFDCNIIGYDKYKREYDLDYIQSVTLEELQYQADIISLHVPYTKETHHLINDSFIDKCKKPFYLVNTARGKNVSLQSLVNGLKSKKVLGACLDVLEIESTSFEEIDFSNLPGELQYLFDASNVILSPHVAGWTEESYIKLSTYLADKIIEDFC